MEHTLLYSEFERSRLEVIYKLVILSIIFSLSYPSAFSLNITNSKNRVLRLEICLLPTVFIIHPQNIFVLNLQFTLNGFFP